MPVCHSICPWRLPILKHRPPNHILLHTKRGKIGRTESINPKRGSSGRSFIVGRAFRYLAYLLVIAAIVVAGYALFFELPAPQSEVVKPVDLPE